MNRLLSQNDWSCIHNALNRQQEIRVYHSDYQTGYVVDARVERLDKRDAKVRGRDMVLTIRQTFPDGNTSTWNFNTADEARMMLYG